MSSKLTPITVRIYDDNLKKKLRRIARRNGRSLSKEAEQVLIRYIEIYERKYGKIDISE